MEPILEPWQELSAACYPLVSDTRSQDLVRKIAVVLYHASETAATKNTYNHKL